MISVSATITEVPKLMTPEAERIWDKAVGDALDVMAEIIAGKAKDFAPVNFGHLRSSIFTERPEGRDVRFVTSPLPYAIVMEDGRRPGNRLPPFDPIALWVQRALRIPRDDPRFSSAVWHLRRKIAKRGIQARGFFKLAAQFGEDKARDIFEHALRTAARRLERRA